MHTVGPWKVVETDAAGEPEFYVLPMGDGPAIVSGLMHHGRRLEESRANAALIAAAPRMFKALLWLDSQGGLGYDKHEEIKRALGVPEPKFCRHAEKCLAGHRCMSEIACND